ncbi:hypothetical protein [Agromyces luteolus]|uniref:Uncharacterized protein n=1 Tax=Agromyces luteolus TaxID=88373 RepID=A0A7C9HLA4_9MICO|nr:hypothetical protein [Agromyces luteolus]MUN07362.1 hypothetical protein [Agromyces luteolus]
MDGMQDPEAGQGTGRRGRHAAPPAGSTGPLSRAVAAVGAGTAAALAVVSGTLARFRAGPVLPWVSAHRLLVLVVGALVVSGAAFTATAAVIAQPPVAERSGSVDDGERPRPGSGFVMPSPVSGSPTPTTAPPTSSATPGPTAPVDDPANDPVDDPAIDPEPTTDPEPKEESNGNGRPDPPGATNRPDKTKD